MYYLGIDGGGTKTVAAVCDEKGKILTKKTGRTINFYSVGFDSARDNLSSLVNEIEKETGINEYKGAFIGCSALDCEADDKLVARLCGGIIKADRIKVNSDLYIVKMSTDCSCVAVCGTGSMVICQDSDGKQIIAGGWGHILGDEGSGYAIALNALKKCCTMSDKGEKTPLADKATEFFGVSCMRDVIDIVYFPETTKDMIAAFASEVGKLAENGDEVSREIIKTQALLFADTAAILLENCDSLGLYGGVFLNNKLFTNTFCDSIISRFPSVSIKTVETPAEESALALAMKL